MSLERREIFLWFVSVSVFFFFLEWTKKSISRGNPKIPDGIFRKWYKTTNSDSCVYFIYSTPISDSCIIIQSEFSIQETNSRSQVYFHWLSERCPWIWLDDRSQRSVVTGPERPRLRLHSAIFVCTADATLGFVYTIPDSSCAGTKNISDRAFVHTQNANFGSIFVPERCCAASFLKVNRHISDRFSWHFRE